MRALLWTTVVCLGCGGAAETRPAVAEAERERLVLMELKAAGAEAAEAAAVTESLCTELSQDPRYELVCPGDLRALLQVQKQERLLGCEEGDCFRQLGDLLKAKKMVAGSVSKLGETWSVSLQLVDAIDAKITRRASRKTSGDAGGLLEQLGPLARELLPR